MLVILAVCSWFHLPDRKSLQSQLECLYVGHALYWQWYVNVLVQHGVVCSTQLSSHYGNWNFDVFLIFCPHTLILSPPTPSPIPQTTLSFTLFSIMHLQLYPPLLLQLFSLIPTTVLTPTALFILSLSLTLLQFSTFSSRWGEVIGLMFQSLFLDNASWSHEILFDNSW